MIEVGMNEYSADRNVRVT